MQKRTIVAYSALGIVGLLFILFQAVWHLPVLYTALRILTIPFGLVGLVLCGFSAVVGVVLLCGIVIYLLVILLAICFPIPLVIWGLTGHNILYDLMRLPEHIEDKCEGSSGAWLVLPVAAMDTAVIGVGILTICVQIWLNT